MTKETEDKIFGKVFLTTCFMLIITLVSGCFEEEPPASKWEWTIHHTGEISNIYYFDQACSKHFHEVQLNFTDGSIIRIKKLVCDHLPKVGEKGDLYVRVKSTTYNYSRVQKNDFKWETTTSASAIDRSAKRGRRSVADEAMHRDPTFIEAQKREREHKEYKEVRALMELAREKPTWEKYNSVIKPSPDVPVLVKLHDDIITVAHLNERGEWKLEVNNGKALGGPTADIKEWRELEL